MTSAERRLVETYRHRSGEALIRDGLCDYQAERAGDLVRRLKPDHSVAILGDPVGTGKTVIALVAALRLIRTGYVEKVLVVTPNATVRGLWRERSRWLGDHTFQQALDIRTARDLPLKKLKPTLVIVDEAHRRMNRRQIHEILVTGQHASHRRLFLSATPFQISVGALGELIAVGDREERLGSVTDALEQYGREVTGLARSARRARAAGPTQAQPEIREALRLAAAKWSDIQDQVIVAAPTAKQLRDIGLKNPPPLVSTVVPVDSGATGWPEAFHIARLIPEITNIRGNPSLEVRATDSLQRGLASSNEAFLHSKAMSALRSSRAPKLRSLHDELRDALGVGTDHPKVKATVSWVRDQVVAGSHVAVFCVWDYSASAMETAIRNDLADHAPTALVKRPPGQSIGTQLRRHFQDPSAAPLVLVLQERFSESIDLDGGQPALVHHDLPWNPARLRQRWGRFVRARSGFTPIPPQKIFVPVLDHETDHRVFDTVRTRAGIGDVLLSNETALHDRSDAEIDVDDWILEALAKG